MKFKNVLGLLFLGPTLVVNAAPRDHGVYLEGDVGSNYAHIDFLDKRSSSFDSMGVGVIIGYQFNTTAAMEAGYTYYGSTKIKSINAALKGIMPFTSGENDFNIFGKIGIANLYTSDDHSVLPYIGLGAGYILSPEWDVNIQAQGGTTMYKGIGLLSAGMAYHFS